LLVSFFFFDSPSTSAFSTLSLHDALPIYATCLIALRFESPLAIGRKRSASSPPSPVFDLPPRRFIAIASVSCASELIDPYDIAPDRKSTRLNSSHLGISYAVFCLKKKNKT